MGLGLVVIARLDASCEVHFRTAPAVSGHAMWTVVDVGVVIMFLVAPWH